jgi:hypothetical protein
VGGRFCEDATVDELQKGELRRWAESVAVRGDPERRAMGKAILLLLAQVDALEADLAEGRAGQTSADQQIRPTAEASLPSRQDTDVDREALQHDSGNRGANALDPSSPWSPQSAANRRIRERLRAASQRMLNR